MNKPRDLHWPATLTPDCAALVQRKEFADFLARDDVVIPPLADREGYNPGEEYKYWLSGFANYLGMREKLSSVLARDLSILDFGGCTGRVARHLVTARPGSQITIAEINASYVNWVNTHFGANCRGLKVGPSPHIPAPDNSFDFAFGISVFTHIDADELAWLSELVRVVKPQCYIYLSILCEQCWAAMDRDILLATTKSAHACSSYPASAVGGPMPVERFSVALEFKGVVNNCNTFHSSSYILRTWNQYAQVEEIAFRQLGEQTAVILKNNKKV